MILAGKDLRPLPEGKVSIRKFNRAWHIYCGGCDRYICEYCAGRTHAQAVAVAVRHIKEKHS